MAVKTYQAYTMSEALAAAKRDLGVDAVILETRSFKRGGFLGLAKKTIFELTAAEADRAELSYANDAAGALRPVKRAARQAYAQTGRRASSDETRRPEPKLKGHLRTRRLAQAMVEAHDRRRRGKAEAPVPAIARDPKSSTSQDSALTGVVGPSMCDQPEPVAAPVGGECRETVTSPARAPNACDTLQGVGGSAGDSPTIVCEPKPVARRFILTPAAGAGLSASRGSLIGGLGHRPDREHRDTPRLFDETASRGRDADVLGRESGSEASSMQGELAAIKQMVGQVLQHQVRSPGRSIPSMPAKLFDLYLALLSQDLSEEIADQIVEEVREALSAAELDDEGTVRRAVLDRLAAFVPTADSAVAPVSPDGRPLTIALIGPTGVGKTTTLAKLAASFKLTHRRRVGLVTCDTYRIAAVDQLRTYANIIGLPLEVALTPAEMKQAVHSLRNCDVILIDTAGRGQKDTGKLQELKSCLAAADPHEIHLVLASTASEKVLLQEAEAFAEVGADKVVLTKLDEAVSFGLLINVIQKVGKQLSFITTGQEVPDHIEVGRPGRLAELVLGAEIHG